MFTFDHIYKRFDNLCTFKHNDVHANRMNCVVLNLSGTTLVVFILSNLVNQFRT